jgi:hypothetical protein
MQLNLEPDFITNYWKNEDVKFYELLEQAGKVETWTLTHEPLFQNKLNEFTNTFKHIDKKIWAQQSENLIDLMSYMTISQFAFLLHYFDETFPGLSIHYVMEARTLTDCAASELFLKRLHFLATHKFLNKIFMPMRTRLVQELISPDS